uniref:C2H2-type domain-containing protein n=1 Tax=Mycena chlorophos TaxID=658473 RepID=A0ABQ0L4N1_MYCCL|nr:predicted protein [Mycena chlorophos]
MAQWSPNPNFADDFEDDTTGYLTDTYGGVVSNDLPTASHYSGQYSRNFGAEWVADRSFVHREYASGSQQLDQGAFSASQYWDGPYSSPAAAPPLESLPPQPTDYQDPEIAFADASQRPEWGMDATARALNTWPPRGSNLDLVVIAPTPDPWCVHGTEDLTLSHDGAGGSLQADVVSTTFLPGQGSSRTERRRKETPGKMHRCDICQKEFPRPSGLKTHMNTHSEERPYPCTVEGCGQWFNTSSNARRHIRTHGVEPPPSLSALRASKRHEYAVNFEEPVVQQEPATTSQAPYRVRWIEVNEKTRGVGWGVRQAEQDEQDGGSGTVRYDESVK